MREERIAIVMAEIQSMGIDLDKITEKIFDDDGELRSSYA